MLQFHFKRTKIRKTYSVYNYSF